MALEPTQAIAFWQRMAALETGVPVAFGVLTLAGPIGFIGAHGAALWILIASVMLSMRARGPTRAASAGSCGISSRSSR